MSSFWQSLPTACRFWLTAIKKARYECYLVVLYVSLFRFILLYLQVIVMIKLCFSWSFWPVVALRLWLISWGLSPMRSSCGPRAGCWRCSPFAQATSRPLLKLVCPHSHGKQLKYGATANVKCGQFIKASNWLVCRRHAGLRASSDRPEPASGPELPLDSEKSVRRCHQAGKYDENVAFRHDGHIWKSCFNLNIYF